MKPLFKNTMTWNRGCAAAVFLLLMLLPPMLLAQSKRIRIERPTQPDQVVCLDDTSDIVLQDQNEILTAVAITDNLEDCGLGSPIDVLNFSVDSFTDSEPGDTGPNQASPGDILEFFVRVNVPADAISPVCFINGDQIVVDETLPFEVTPPLIANGTTQIRDDIDLTVAAGAPNGSTDFTVDCSPGNPGDPQATDSIEIINGVVDSEVTINSFLVDGATQSAADQGDSVQFSFNLTVPADIAADAACQISAPSGVFTPNPIVIDPANDGNNLRNVNLLSSAPLGQQTITLTCTPGDDSDSVLLTIEDDDPPVSCPDLPPEAVRDTPFLYTNEFPNGWGGGLGPGTTILTFDAGKYLALGFNSDQAPPDVDGSLFSWGEATASFNSSTVTFSISQCEGQFEPQPGDDPDCYMPFATLDSAIQWRFDTVPGNNLSGICEMQRGQNYFLNAVFATPQNPFGPSLCDEMQCSTLISSTREPAGK